jgi:D-alanyl-D-alanine dipeptidase
MRPAPALLAIILAAACAAPSQPPREADPLVDVSEEVPNVVQDIRYATTDNFTGKVLYPVKRCLLRRSTARRLRLVQQDLEQLGMGLKVWDCYRPLAIQHELWRIVPDPRYVANPEKGSRHNRGAAVDVTLVDAKGAELEMPTDYDDFSKSAHRNATDASARAIRNRGTLEKAMTAHGFVGLRTEWWHFDAPDWIRHALLDQPLDRPVE